ncbi:phosphatase 2C-like domain-containing protein [Lipomyces japonicus]|uniref:phosphatase 2C-like domain-containing protein n=1 Tax=Lipomyces japonicus TaxID=56871 RepID=UPI0034CE6A96
MSIQSSKSESSPAILAQSKGNSRKLSTSPTTSFFSRFTSNSNASSSIKSQKEQQQQQQTGSSASSSSASVYSNAVSPPPWFNGTFSVGVSEDWNLKYRNTMEDTHCVIYDFAGGNSSEINSSGLNPLSAFSKNKTHHRSRSNSFSQSASHLSPASTPHEMNDAGYFAVFDGHAGKTAADWCGQKLHTALEEQLRKDPKCPVPEVLDRTFTESDTALQKLSLKTAGCTAIVALLRWEDKPVDLTISNDATVHHLYHQHHFLTHHGEGKNSSSLDKTKTTKERMLYTANAGDARIVLCRSGRALRLSYDHKGTDPVEAQRVRNSGGVILNGRVNGILAVTRALGDVYIKKLVTSHPYTTETYITSDDEFLILACDGLWDVCSDQQAVDLIRDIEDPQAASHTLVDYALKHFSMDNLTCMVVRFDDRMKQEIRQNHGVSSAEANFAETETELESLSVH